MRVEANGNRHRDETERDRKMKIVQHLPSAGSDLSRLNLTAEKDVHRSQGQSEPGHVCFVDLFKHGVGLKEINDRIHKGQNRRNRSEQRSFAFRLQRDQGRDSEDGEE